MCFYYVIEAKKNFFFVLDGFWISKKVKTGESAFVWNDQKYQGRDICFYSGFEGCCNPVHLNCYGHKDTSIIYDEFIFL